MTSMMLFGQCLRTTATFTRLATSRSAKGVVECIILSSDEVVVEPEYKTRNCQVLKAGEAVREAER